MDHFYKEVTLDNINEYDDLELSRIRGLDEDEDSDVELEQLVRDKQFKKFFDLLSDMSRTLVYINDVGLAVVNYDYMDDDVQSIVEDEKDGYGYDEEDNPFDLEW